MDWTLLGIAPTTDKNAITAAYRAQLARTNPEDDPEAIISVPAYFNDLQRKATKRADELEDALGEEFSLDFCSCPSSPSRRRLPHLARDGVILSVPIKRELMRCISSLLCVFKAPAACGGYPPSSSAGRRGRCPRPPSARRTAPYPRPRTYGCADPNRWS